jgi:hypothetical protein
MLIKINIILMMLLCLFTQTVLGYYTKEKMIEMLQSQDVQIRISVLKTINGGLKRGDLQLADSVKNICYRLIEEEFRGKPGIDMRKDEEAQYPSEIGKLVININDEVTLPYLVKEMGLDSFGRKAILKHGQKALGMSLEDADKYNEYSPIRKNGFVYLMADFIDARRTGYVATGEMRSKIKDTMLRIYSEIEYPNKKDKEYESKIAALSREVISPFVTFFQVLGDKDVIPLVEKIAKENEFKESYRIKYEKYRQMPGEELMKHWDEVEKLSAEDDAKIKAKGANALKDEARVVKYPVREKAAKVLAELKKKHGIK